MHSSNGFGGGGGGGDSGGSTMDSARVGLDFIVENPEYMTKLAAALDTSNTQVKKQIVELLSALCVYNEQGYARAIETLDKYKQLKGKFFFFIVFGRMTESCEHMEMLYKRGQGTKSAI